MNTMLNNQNQNNLIKQIKDFQNEIVKSGENPEELLEKELNSGKYSKQQIEWAKNMAKLFANKI